MYNIFIYYIMKSDVFFIEPTIYLFIYFHVSWYYHAILQFHGTTIWCQTIMP